MKKAILTFFFVVSFYALFFVPDEITTAFIIDEFLKLAIWVASGRALDRIKDNKKPIKA